MSVVKTKHINMNANFWAMKAGKVQNKMGSKTKSVENPSSSIKLDLMPFRPAFHKGVPGLRYPLKTQPLKSK